MNFRILTFSILTFGASSAFNAPIRALEIPKNNRNFAAAAATQTMSETARVQSLSALLQLKPAQIERLNSLIETHAKRRREVEKRIATLSGELRQVQSPLDWNQGRALELQREIGTERQRAEDNLRATRSKALTILSETQRAQLQSIPNDARFILREDAWWQLLVMPVENLWRFASITTRENAKVAQNRNSSRDKGSGRYGVYGGYGYGGPQYGVYGSYGQGPVGAHVGIGRGGPHFSIGVGGGFGLGW